PAIRILGMPSAMASCIARDAQHNLEQPGTGAVASVLELVEAPVGHDEDFLGPVLDVGLVDTEPAQVAPHEIHVCLVECPEAPCPRFDGDGSRYRHRADGH